MGATLTESAHFAALVQMTQNMVGTMRSAAGLRDPDPSPQ